jgi:galactokinase
MLESFVTSTNACRAAFVRHFGGEPRVFSAPGRVNLIGEHTDYNGGFVLPMAIERRTFVAAAPRTDRLVVARSEGIEGELRVDLDAPPTPRRGGWGDYVEGMVRMLVAGGVPLRGTSLYVTSDVPAGAGLSASAALEIGVGLALAALAGQGDIDRVKLALAGQAAEHEHVGTLCGIMDQYVVALAREGAALLIDCRSLEPRIVPMDLGSTRLVVCDTRVKHELASSAYNERRAQCEEAVALIGASVPGVRALRDVSREDCERLFPTLPEPLGRRARHVVSENARTLAAAELLEHGELDRLGSLMVASHESLRDDYEVSSPELDLAVEVALSVPGVYGARMTGGGFGGCAIALAAERAVGELTDAWQRRLRERFGRSAEVFASAAAQAATEH